MSKRPDMQTTDLPPKEQRSDDVLVMPHPVALGSKSFSDYVREYRARNKIPHHQVVNQKIGPVKIVGHDQKEIEGNAEKLGVVIAERFNTDVVQVTIEDYYVFVDNEEAVTTIKGEDIKLVGTFYYTVCPGMYTEEKGEGDGTD